MLERVACWVEVVVCGVDSWSADGEVSMRPQESTVSLYPHVDMMYSSPNLVAGLCA